MIGQPYSGKLKVRLDERRVDAADSDHRLPPTLHFIVLVSVPPGPDQMERAQAVALDEKAALAAMLKERLALELSETKTLVTPVTAGMRFLGFNVGVRRRHDNGRLISTAVVPRDRSWRLREQIKAIFQPHTLRGSLADRLRLLNPMLRGWANFYRHAYCASRFLGDVDHYVWWTILRWLKKKHRRAAMHDIAARYGWRRPGGGTLRWRDGDVKAFQTSSVKPTHYNLAWECGPSFARSSMESPVHSERCTPGSARGARKPAGESR